MRMGATRDGCERGGGEMGLNEVVELDSCYSPLGAFEGDLCTEAQAVYIRRLQTKSFC